MSINRERQLRVKWLHDPLSHVRSGLVMQTCTQSYGAPKVSVGRTVLGGAQSHTTAAPHPPGLGLVLLESKSLEGGCQGRPWAVVPTGSLERHGCPQGLSSAGVLSEALQAGWADISANYIIPNCQSEK